MDRKLQLLGIAKKAGMLAVGGDDVSVAARNEKARLIISANDASEGSVRRARENAKSYGAVHIRIPYSKFEIGNITRRGSPGTLAILNEGLAARFLKSLAEDQPEIYGEAAETMAEEARAATEMKKKTHHGKRRTAI